MSRSSSGRVRFRAKAHLLAPLPQAGGKSGTLRDGGGAQGPATVVIYHGSLDTGWMAIGVRWPACPLGVAHELKETLRFEVDRSSWTAEGILSCPWMFVPTLQIGEGLWEG